MPTVPTGYSSNVTTPNGTVYMYLGVAAGNAIMASMVRAQLAAGQQKQQAGEALARTIGGNAQIEPITVGIISAIIAAVGATAGAVSAAAGATNAGINVANLASKGQPAGSQALELVFHNDGPGPIVPYQIRNANCSTASTLRPLLPGASGSIDVLQSGGFDGSSYLEVDCLVNGGWVPNGISSAVKDVSPINTAVKFTYAGGDWVPTLSIDGCKPMQPTANTAIALYFVAGSGVGSLDFTIATGISQKGTSSIDVVFLPGSNTWNN